MVINIKVDMKFVTSVKLKVFFAFPEYVVNINK